MCACRVCVPAVYVSVFADPFPSTYITFSVGPGLLPLPAWPLQEACARGGLGSDLGIRVSGDVEAVRYNVSIGGEVGRQSLRVAVDWNRSSADWDEGSLSAAAVRASGILQLIAACQ